MNSILQSSAAFWMIVYAIPIIAVIKSFGWNPGESFAPYDVQKFLRALLNNIEECLARSQQSLIFSGRRSLEC
jgi:hypothetical protein